MAIGELLWDVFPAAEHLGGAAFNFCAHAARLGHEVLFLSAVGDDDRGCAALAEAARLGIPTDFVRTAPSVPTGIVSVKLDPAGVPDFTIHRPAAYDQLRLSAEDLARLAEFAPTASTSERCTRSRPRSAPSPAAFSRPAMARVDSTM